MSLAESLRAEQRLSLSPRQARLPWVGVRFFFAWLLLSPGALAAPLAMPSLAIVLSDDSAPYQEVYEAIKARTDDRDIEASRVYAQSATAEALNTRLIVSIGARAAEAVAKISARTPVLAVLVPRDWYQKTGRALLAGPARRPVSAIYLDQPFERQAELIHLAFPGIKRVGILVGAGHPALEEGLRAALRSQNLALVSETLHSGQKLIEPLEAIFSAVDLLLAIPDPVVFNRLTAPSVFLTSYRYRDPVVGYSSSLTRAGALISLYSTPAQIGRQAAEAIFRGFGQAAVQLPAPAYPRYFSVAVNRQVARSLGFKVPPETELERRLRQVRGD